MLLFWRVGVNGHCSAGTAARQNKAGQRLSAQSRGDVCRRVDLSFVDELRDAEASLFNTDALAVLREALQVVDGPPVQEKGEGPTAVASNPSCPVICSRTTALLPYFLCFGYDPYCPCPEANGF